MCIAGHVYSRLHFQEICILPCWLDGFGLEHMLLDSFSGTSLTHTGNAQAAWLLCTRSLFKPLTVSHWWIHPRFWTAREFNTNNHPAASADLIHLSWPGIPVMAWYTCHGLVHLAWPGAPLWPGTPHDLVHLSWPKQNYIGWSTFTHAKDIIFRCSILDDVQHIHILDFFFFLILLILYYKQV